MTISKLRLKSMAHACLASTLLLAGPALAQTVDWDNGGTSMNWTNALNWAPNGLPGSGNDVRIGNLANGQNDDTIIDDDFRIQGLFIENFSSADTAGNTLQVGSSGVNLGFAGELIVSENRNGDSLLTTGIDISNMSILRMNGGRAVVGGSVTTNIGGFFTGYGQLNFNNGLGAPTTIFTNNGSLSTSRPVGSDPRVPVTLSLTANDADARIDLDGTGNNRVVSLANNSILELGIRQDDHFRGTLHMGFDSILDTRHLFQSTASSAVEVNANSGTATIRGVGYNGRSGSEVNVTSGTLRFDATANFFSGSSINLANGASVQFDQPASLLGNVTMGVTSSLIANSAVTVTNAGFDMDGGSGTGIMQVGTGGHLTINADSVDGADNEFDGSIRINGGTFTTNFATGDLRIERNANILFNTSSGDSRIDGEAIDLFGTMRATGDGLVRVSTATTFNAGSASIVEEGADMFFTRSLNFNGGSSHTAVGNGEISIGSNTIVNGDTTIDMPTGVFQIDSNQTNQTMTLNADLTVNARTLRSHIGGEGSGIYTVNVENNGSTLAVNLTDPADSWTLGADGIVNINGQDGPQTAIAGSDLRVLGRINVNRTARIASRLEVEEGGTVSLTDHDLLIDGGTASAPNRLNGGGIFGSGRLRSAISGLHGHGTIAPDIFFSSGADLVADGGTLFVQGDVEFADRVAVNSGSTMFVSRILNTSNVTELRLNGGTFAGVNLHNDGSTKGHGTISTALLRNRGEIVAQGGNLIIDTVNAPDLDGGERSAMLHADTGNITIVDALDGDFDGVLRIEPRQSIEFEESWTQGRDGVLQMIGASGSPSELKGAPFSMWGKGEFVGDTRITSHGVFRPGGVFTLADRSDRLSVSRNLTVKIDATVEGDGTLHLSDFGQLLLEDGAQIGVHLENRGFLRATGDSVTVDLTSYQQFGDGEMVVSLSAGGPDLFRFDGEIHLDGELSVTQPSTFQPSLGDSFRFITADDVNGTFATLDLPGLDTGLDWQIDYGQTSVSLNVIAAMLNPGDFDNDGDYSCSDVDSLVAAIAGGSGDLTFDLTGDGTVDQADLGEWLAEAGAAELASGNPYLPGDANLDSVVDASDFNLWNSSKFTSTAAWCAGDFTADGVVDTSDFNVWNSNKFQSADAHASVVPEPNAIVLFLMGLVGFFRRKRR